MEGRKNPWKAKKSLSRALCDEDLTKEQKQETVEDRHSAAGLKRQAGDMKNAERKKASQPASRGLYDKEKRK